MVCQTMPWQQSNLPPGTRDIEVNRLIYPDKFIVYNDLAEAHFELGNHDKAKVNYSKALELRPDGEDILRVLDKVAARQ